jgi:hypothetical protein
VASLGTLVLLGVVVIAAILVERLLHPGPGPAQVPPMAGGPGVAFFNGNPNAMFQGPFDNPPDANAAVKENLIARLPEHPEETLEPEGSLEPEQAQPQDALPADIPAAAVQKVKRSTVHIRVHGADGLKGEGSGFFAFEPGVVVTNAHVVGMLHASVAPPKQIDVVVFSGEPNEKRLTGTVLGVDRSADLAVLRVPKAPFLPPPLRVQQTRGLSEVQKVYIFGFPFGSQLGKQITVSVSSISQLRKDRFGRINKIQVNGGMHQGNSGGPVVDARGDVVGVSVSVIHGTLINFAVPGDFVLAAHSGRVLSARTGHPLKNGANIEMSYELSLLDPLQKLRAAKVEYWYGPAGTVRPQSLTKPAPLAGDDPHQMVDLVYKDGAARGVLQLAPAAKGKVLYTRPVLVSTAGKRIWGAARPNRSQPTVERKPALLAWKNHAAMRKVLLDTTSRLRYSNTDTDWRIESQLEENVQPLQAGANLRLTHKRVRVGPFAYGTWSQDFTQIAQAARALKDAASVAEADAAGTPAPPQLENERGRNFVLMKDINDLHVQFSQGFALASIPLPNRLVNPDETWKAERGVMLGGKTLILDLSCTYEGMRKRGEREEALIRVAGGPRTANGQGKPDTGKVRGQAVFDIAAGQITSAKVEANLEMELTIPNFGGVQATGAVVSQLTRSTANVPGQYRQVFRVEDKLTAAEPKDKLQPGYHKVFKVPMKAGKTYLINMVAKNDAANDAGAQGQSANFDPYLRLEDALGYSLAEDDDSGGGLNAQILFQPAVDGEYQVIATTFSAEQLGSFVLTVDEE